MDAFHRTPQEQFLENIDDDEAVAIVRRCLIPTDRLQIRAEIGKGAVRSLAFCMLLTVFLALDVYFRSYYPVR